MNEVSESIVQWLERKRRKGRASAAVISALAFGGGMVVFLATALLVFAVLFIVCGAFSRSVLFPAALAFAATAWLYVRLLKARHDELDLKLDPMGFWILQDISFVGPRLILEGLSQLRRCAQLGEMNVRACARALAFLARHDSAVSWQELVQHSPELGSTRLREQLSLLDGVLFLGTDAARISLMEPFRLRLRWMLGREPASGKAKEPARPSPEPGPHVVPVNEPEKLSPYEILGLLPSASVQDIKAAYRKRVKECHPDLFSGMDQHARDLAERWTKALNAAYSTLKARQEDARVLRAGGAR